MMAAYHKISYFVASGEDCRFLSLEVSCGITELPPQDCFCIFFVYLTFLYNSSLYLFCLFLFLITITIFNILIILFIFTVFYLTLDLFTFFIFFYFFIVNEKTTYMLEFRYKIICIIVSTLKLHQLKCKLNKFSNPFSKRHEKYICISYRKK